MGQLPDRGIAGVMLDPAAEAEIRKHKRSHGVRDFAEKSVALYEVGALLVYRPHAAWDLAERGAADKQIYRQQVNKRQIAYVIVIAEPNDLNREKPPFSVIWCSI